MKIAYITDGIFPYVVGGMQVVSRKHIEGLAERGNGLVVVHAFRRENVRQTDLPGKVIAIKWPYSRGPFRFSPWHYSAELKRYSRDVHRVIQREEPDVVYAEGPLVYETLLRSNRCPVVFHPHGLDMFQNQMSLVRNLRTNVLKSLFSFHARRSDRVISQGGHLTTLLESRIGVDAKRIAQLPNSVPALATEKPKARLNLPLRCLFVGRDDPKKGLGVLLDAVQHAEVDLHLHIVGIARRQLSGSPITWHGVVRDRQRIAGFYRDNDVLVLPSYSEGMATVLLEAMSHGMPAIATDVGASREVVIPGQTGWLVPAGDERALRAALSELRSLSPEQFRAMSQACLDHIAAHFLDHDVCDHLHRILAESQRQRSNSRARAA